MGGSTVPELAWRLMKGGELPRLPPRNVVFLVGINDARHGGYDPSPMMEELVKWVMQRLPGSRVFVHALLPTAKPVKYSIRQVNAGYKELAERTGARFLDCGAAMDPADRRLFSDGLHPSRHGHDLILACLKRELAN
jgi:lysophospholipase L1-like esterase